MKPKHLAVLVAPLFLAALAMPNMTLADDDDDDGLEFEAELSGAEEVPIPVDTATTGEAEFEVNRSRTKIKFELEIEKAVGILAVAGAHIHCAPAGANGPVVAFLAGVVPGGLNGDVEIKGTLTDDNILDDSCGSDIAELVEAMSDGDTYVNVHSAGNPAGEVRGQIEREDD